MTTFRTILFITLIALPLAASAQTELRHRGDTIGVSSSGRELMTITSDADDLSLCVGGFRINLGTGERPAARQHQNQHRHTHKRNRLAKSFSIGGLSFGFNGLTSPDYSMYDDETWKFLDLHNAKSINFAFEVKSSFALSHSRRSWLAVGLRPRWDNYTFSEQITIEKLQGMIHPVELVGMKRYKKSKLTTFSLDIPVMYTIYPAKGLSVTGGVYGGLTLGQHTKVKFNKEKHKGGLGVNFFNAGVTARVQYCKVGVFANYGLTPLFKNGVGPKTHPITIGLIFW